MDKIQSFEEFLAVSRANIPLISVLINIFSTAILGSVLGWVYVKYGNTLSNRRLFSRNFILIAMTTTLIITIVKSSLALSLGLVGALSIIRFRTAIKEPEEISYLFLAISIGLGFGANQSLVTISAFLIIIFIIVITQLLYKNELFNQNVYLKIATRNKNQLGVEKVINIINEYCRFVDLKRLDETNEVYELSLLVEFDEFNQLNEAKKELQKIDNTLEFTFLDNKIVH